MRFTLFEVFVIIGIIQGFIVSGLIWVRSHQSISKILLSVVLVVFNLLCIKILIHTTGLWQYDGFRYLPLGIELAIQPLIWIYITSLVQPNFKLVRKHAWHFIPFVLSMLYSVGIYMVTRGQANLNSQDAIANIYWFNTVKEWEDYLSILSGVVYWALGVRLIARYRSWLFQNVSNTDYPTLYWLRNIAALMGILIMLLTTAILLDAVFNFSFTHFIHWQVFFLYLSLLIYILGFKGYQMVDPRPVLLSDSSDVSEPSAEAEGTKLSRERVEQVRLAILHALETEELFLDPELNLSKLANFINVSVSITSKVINNSFGKSFRNLINNYRVERVKKMLKNTDTRRLSIAGIASECGFNSEASFYRIFKSVEGVSPKVFIERL